MKKHIRYIPVWVAVAALLGTCMNVLDPPTEPGALSGGKGRLAIRVEDNARTLMPDSLTFDRYVLRFEYTGGTGGYTHDGVEWSAGVSVDLEPGNWTVHADAYAGRVVSGTGSAAVTVSAGTDTPVTIRIGINLDPAITGTLKYTVDYPPPRGGLPDSVAKLYVYDMAGAQAAGYPVTITRGEGGPLTLPAGVYRIRVTVEDPVNRTSASESGVAHIYGGKETPLEFNFTAAHFMAEIPLTVTANLTLPTGVTADPNSRAIAVYRDEDCTNPTGGFVRRSPDESDSVTFWIPTYEGETVYLRQEFVVGGINMYLGEPYAVEIDFGSPVPPITERYFKVDVEPDIPNGTVEVVSGWAIALPGATITLRVTPNPGYRLRPQSLKYYDGSAYALLASDAVSFDMPRADVTIYAEFVDYGIRYVKESGTGDGSSWENASNNIQKMMDELAVASLDTDTTPRYSGLYIVKVGAGTYKPKYEPMVLSDPAVLGEYPDNGSPASRDAAFMLRPGVQVWGGYPASSEGNDDTRDPATYVTTLSGDLDGDNSIGSGDAYHVVLAVNIPDDGKTVLDGLTISGGYGNGTDDITLNDNPIPRNSGGGIYAYSSALELTNVTVSGNKANDTGGGVYVSGGTFAMSGGTISGNEASSDNPDDYDTGNGGGIYVGNSGTFTMSGGTISGNIATYTDLDPGDPNLSSGNGGGVYVGNSGTFTMSGGTVSGNEASKNGGGVYVETYGTDETFTKTGDSIIYGDTNTTHDSNSDENTAGSGEGHAVYVKTRNSPLKRNTTANSSVVLSNSDTGTGWE